MDLSTLSIPELRDLQQQIPAEIKRREVAEKINILNEVRAFAKARGYAIEELLGKDVKVKATTGNKVKVKYRHPEHAELEWTGRGRRPKWVESWLANGSTLDSLLV
jgi:DNA-binding protein H-NS